MGDVVSLFDAGAQLAVLGGEAIEVSGPPGALAGAAMPPLRFRDGDDVTVRYRAWEGRPETSAVMFGPTAREVVQALCRRLARSPERLIATSTGKLLEAWICDAQAVVDETTGRRTWEAGPRLAQVKGVGWATINMILKKPTAGPRPKPPAGPPPPSEPRPAEREAKLVVFENQFPAKHEDLFPDNYGDDE